MTMGVSDAELLALLKDSVALWGVDAPVAVGADSIAVGTLLVQRAPADMRPVRWLLQTTERAAANRSPRALPSVVALLSALRNALGAEGANRLRIGA